MQASNNDRLGLGQLYPNLSEEEILAAGENLGRYLLVALEIVGTVVPKTSVDTSVSTSTLKERSNSNLKDSS
jgi:hypothetical protein